jgi:hypothetical protein
MGWGKFSSNSSPPSFLLFLSLMGVWGGRRNKRKLYSLSRVGVEGEIGENLNPTRVRGEIGEMSIFTYNLM